METCAELFAAYYEKKQILAPLEKEVKDLRLKILGAMGDKKILCENGYLAKVTPTTKTTLLREPIEALLGRELPENCMRVVPSNTLKVSLLTEDKKADADGKELIEEAL